jgi:hypothetical protein
MPDPHPFESKGYSDFGLLVSRLWGSATMVNMFSDETIWRRVFGVIGGHIPLLIVTSFQIITPESNNIGAPSNYGTSAM